jgi:hypothetical protein
MPFGGRTAANSAADDTPADQSTGVRKPQQETEADKTGISGSVSILSDYRSRGISQTMRQPSAQMELTYTAVNGLYLGIFGSNVQGNNTCLELDFSVGFRGKGVPRLLKAHGDLPNLEYNLGVIYYYYPGGQVFNKHQTRYNTFEYFIEAACQWLTVKFSQSLSNYGQYCSNAPPFDFCKKRFLKSNRSSKGSIYIEASGLFTIWKKQRFLTLQGGELSLLLHVGHQYYRHYNVLSYTDWLVTLTQQLPLFDLFFSYVGTNAQSCFYTAPDSAFHPNMRATGGQGIIAGIVKSF